MIVERAGEVIPYIVGVVPNLRDGSERKIGFPQSTALIERELIITQGTIEASLYALENGVALNVAGGTHHAFAERGEGFCLHAGFSQSSDQINSGRTHPARLCKAGSVQEDGIQ